MSISVTTTFDFHPLANIFPLIEGAAFDELVADIKSHGLREPIWLYDGQILDGRNRYRACDVAGIEPRFTVYEGDNPLAFVISLNLKRRHLNESQRAMIASKLANLGEGRPSKTAQIYAVSQSEAAELLNVSRASVQSAAKVYESAEPEVVAAVESGKLPVSFAKGLTKQDANFQKDVVGFVNEGFKPTEARHRARGFHLAIETPRALLPSPGKGRKIRVAQNAAKRQWLIAIGPDISTADLRAKQASAKESEPVKLLQQERDEYLAEAAKLEAQAKKLMSEAEKMRKESALIDLDIDDEVAEIVGKWHPFTETYDFQCDEQTDKELAALSDKARVDRLLEARGLVSEAITETERGYWGDFKVGSQPFVPGPSSS
jgi:hypothetical protein